MNGVTVSSMTRDDLALAVEWAAREGWNPGVHDVDAFWAADPGGYVMAREGDRIVGVVSCVRYDPQYAFAGFYIVDPQWRGRGVGHRLSEWVLEQAGDRILGIDGVVEQQPTYLLLGFELVHRNIRFGGVVETRPASRDLRVLGPADLDVVAAYDRLCFPAQRREFLSAWLAMDGTLAVGVPAEGGLAGYGVLRPCRRGFKIGPLFADDESIADALLDRLLAQAGAGSEVFLDVPEPNTAAVDMARARGLGAVFETARMYRGGVPDLPLSKVYGITTFELG